jgi:uncharacterized protein YegP (UPF0339 family)
MRPILRWLGQPHLESLSDYLRGSEAGDLLDRVRPQLARAGVVMSARMGGDEAWSDLEETIEYALTWLVPAAGGGGRPATFEIIPGESSGYWWRLTAANGRIIASSAEPYASAAAALTAAGRVHSVVHDFSFRVIADGGAYRWNVVAENGRLLAASTESFSTERDAARAARSARSLAANAALPGRAGSESINLARRHVTKTPDGRWQVRAEGATRAASTHTTQADAVRSAKQQVLNSRGAGEVIVHGRDGRIRSADAVNER